MFDDILGEDKVEVKEQKKVVTPRNKINVRGVGIIDKKKPSQPMCDNCRHGSHILSNYPDKVLCQKYRRHKDINYVCKNWELRK